MKKLLSAVLLHALLLPIAKGQSKLFDQDVQLKSCNISIEANPFIATTFIEMEFYNPKNVEVEGYQNFKLNKGQVVTAFQLDLNGKYRDGSIEEKWKAVRAYSSIVGKRIDPAILQMGYDYNYSLRIYPIPAHSSRKITMTIDQLMLEDSMQLKYELPLSFQSSTASFRLAIKVSNSTSMPACNKGFLEDRIFTNKNMLATLSIESANIKLNQPIRFSIPLKTTTPRLCISKHDGVSSFLLRFSPTVPNYYPVKPGTLSVFWDVSSSSSARNIKKEIDFLEQYIVTNKIAVTTISLFNQKIQHRMVFDARNKKFDLLRKFLLHYKYSGATTFSNLDLADANAGAILIFTEGYNSYGKSMPEPGTVPINCIVSAPFYDQTFLYRLIGETGGSLISIYKKAIPDAVTEITKAQNFLLKYSSSARSVIINEKFPIKLSDNILLSGTFKTTDQLQLIFGNSGTVNKIENVYLLENNYCGKDIYQKVQMLKSYDSMMGKANWQELVVFGLTKKVITTQTAYLVLERIEDYIKYNIAPPKELEAQCAEMNYVYKSEYKIRALKTFSEQETLLDLVRNYNHYVEWWGNNEALIDLNKAQEIASTENLPDKSITKKNNAVAQSTAANEAGSNTIKEVIVTSAFQTKRTLRSQTSSIQNISAEQLNIVRGYDVNNALAGKVAGLQVRSQSAVALGRETSVRLRGENGLGAGKGPLYVVDGTIMPDANFINPDDIDNITVLQGPSACALFGSDAANGAVVITNKRGRKNYYNYNTKWREYKLKNMEEVDYMGEITGFEKNDLWNRYLEIEKSYKGNPGFYFDMADYFFERELKEIAIEILFDAIESCRGNTNGLKAAAYMFEDWKYFDEAIKIYKDIMAENPADLSCKRDLALAYFQNGDYQLAVNSYYKIICGADDNVYYDDRLQIRVIALNEMNAVIHLYKEKLDLSAINTNLIKQMPLDLRITVESNYGYLGNTHILNPGGKECSSYSSILNDTRSSYNFCNYYYSYNDQNEYLVKDAEKGTYKVKVNCHYYNYYYTNQKKIPIYLRLVIFKNFQKAGQSMEVQHIVLDNQYGHVEVAEIKW